METRWLYTTSENFYKLRDASNYTCVIPMGCVEKHSLHLPLGTDIIQSSHIAYLASQLETMCVFPDFTFGDVSGTDFDQPAGTITLPLETIMLLLEQLCDNIGRYGFKKILVYNGHGGNKPWLKAFARNINNKNKDYVFAIAHIDLPVPHKMAEIILEKGSGAIPELTKEDEELLLKYHAENMELGHACMSETAYILGIAPESVKMDRVGIENGKNRGYTAYLRDAGIELRDGGWAIDYPDMFCGDDPIGCNERIGSAAVRLESERLAKAFKVYKEDENIIKWNEARKKKK